MWKMADHFPELSEGDLNMKTNLVFRWLNNINNNIELSYHKIFWFVSGEQINYLPQPPNMLVCKETLEV